eukprot:gb/GFBE01005090.1/.p1 GENE.gb/GFBE01005090.1/~~gb/GFBE01005090.1/.p1  ORF type:complete len:308 (+),score=29.76 gb/GFBE01005090.1/:1-924(+)
MSSTPLDRRGRAGALLVFFACSLCCCQASLRGLQETEDTVDDRGSGIDVSVPLAVVGAALLSLCFLGFCCWAVCPGGCLNGACFNFVWSGLKNPEHPVQPLEHQPEQSVCKELPLPGVRVVDCERKGSKQGPRQGSRQGSKQSTEAVASMETDESSCSSDHTGGKRIRRNSKARRRSTSIGSESSSSSDGSTLTPIYGKLLSVPGSASDPADPKADPKCDADMQHCTPRSTSSKQSGGSRSSSRRRSSSIKHLGDAAAQVPPDVPVPGQIGEDGGAQLVTGSRSLALPTIQSEVEYSNPRVSLKWWT